MDSLCYQIPRLSTLNLDLAGNFKSCAFLTLHKTASGQALCNKNQQKNGKIKNIPLSSQSYRNLAHRTRLCSPWKKKKKNWSWRREIACIVILVIFVISFLYYLTEQLKTCRIILFQVSEVSIHCGVEGQVRAEWFTSWQPKGKADAGKEQSISPRACLSDPLLASRP